MWKNVRDLWHFCADTERGEEEHRSVLGRFSYAAERERGEGNGARMGGVRKTPLSHTMVWFDFVLLKKLKFEEVSVKI